MAAVFFELSSAFSTIDRDVVEVNLKWKSHRHRCVLGVL